MDAQKIIDDIIKGAQSSEGFLRGGKVGVEHQVLGEEIKLAGGHPGLGAALGGIPGAALGAEPGHRADAAFGSLVGGTAGGIGGGATGAIIGLLAKNPVLAAQLGVGGSVAGGYLGSVLGARSQGRSHTDRLLDKLSSDCATLPAAYEAGAKAACEQYKVAFIPALIAGAARLAGPLASVAKKLLPGAKKLTGNKTFRSLGGQAAGGAALQGGMNAVTPKQPPQ